MRGSALSSFGLYMHHHPQLLSSILVLLREGNQRCLEGKLILYTDICIKRQCWNLKNVYVVGNWLEEEYFDRIKRVYW